MQRTHGLATAVILAAAGLSTGCASMPKPSWFGKSSLPSPTATVSATENKNQKPTMPIDDQASANMEIARARGYERSGQYDKARKVYETLRQREPNNLAVMHRLGCVADLQRRHGEAEQLFMAVVAKEPRNSEAMGDLGYCYFLQGKLPQAEQVLRQAVALQPECARHHNNLGLVLGHLEREAEAIAEFQRGGNEADAWYNMAFVYASQDKIEQAKVCFRKSLAVDPLHSRSRDSLASFEDYERKPQAFREAEEESLADSRLVPYIEGGERSAVQQASAEVPSSRDAGRAVRQLQLESRGLQNRSSISQSGNGS